VFFGEPEFFFASACDRLHSRRELFTIPGHSDDIHQCQPTYAAFTLIEVLLRFPTYSTKLGAQIYEYRKDLLYGSDVGNGSALNLNRIELAHA
jgi:hypothetical protein